jgi:Divergent InlB B-repeat domain
LTRLNSASLARHQLALVAAFVTLSLVLLLSPGSAFAGVSGQQGPPWGPEVGVGPGEVFNGRPMGVDSADGSVFIGSFNEAVTEMVFQKFSSTGTFEGAVTLPGLGYVGIAVDSAHHRFYVLKDEGAAQEVTKILAFSTIPNGSKQLVPASTAELPVPTGTATLFHPQELVIDPSSGDLIALAKNEEGLTVLQRIEVDPTTGAGTVGASFVDEGEVIQSSRGIAVDAQGITYVLSFVESSGEELTADTLPADFSHSSSLNPVPGFEAAVVGGGVTSIKKAAAFNYGPQIAVSTSPVGGDTIFWKHELSNTAFSIESYSVNGEAKGAVFGGGTTEGECKISTVSTSLATLNSGSLIAFDQGTSLSTPTQAVTHFPIVYSFGPGGSGCPAAASAFKTEAGGHAVTSVATGSTVTFNGSGSELNGTVVEKTIWKIEGPEDFTETVTGPTLTFSHPLIALGNYTIRMTIEGLSESEEGTLGTSFSAQPQTLEVKAGGTAEFPLNLSTSGTGSGSFKCKVNGGGEETCAAEYEAGKEVEVIPSAATGSKFANWTGDCTGTGACLLTMNAAHSVVGVFNAESTPPAAFNLTITPPSNGSILCNSGAGAGNCAAKYAKGTVVTLTATPASGFEFANWTGDCSGSGACSVTMSAAHTVGASFKAVQSGGGGGGGNTGGGGGGTNTPPPGGGTPPPGGGGGTPHKTPAQILAEKRKKAVAKCKKLNGKAEAKCLVKARQIGKPKKKKGKGKVRASARIVRRRTW